MGGMPSPRSGVGMISLQTCSPGYAVRACHPSIKHCQSDSVLLSLRERLFRRAERDEYTAGYAHVPLLALATTRSITRMFAIASESGVGTGESFRIARAKASA